jgi:hypothetical protein
MPSFIVIGAQKSGSTALLAHFLMSVQCASVPNTVHLVLHARLFTHTHIFVHARHFTHTYIFMHTHIFMHARTHASSHARKRHPHTLHDIYAHNQAISRSCIYRRTHAPSFVRSLKSFAIWI